MLIAQRRTSSYRPDLPSKVVVDRGDVGARLLADVAYRNGLEPVRGEQTCGGIEQTVAGLAVAIGHYSVRLKSTTATLMVTTEKASR